MNSFDEAIRTLRNSILLTDFDRRIRSLMVTSSAPSEGKSTTAAHLAIAHAQQGRRTLLIDGDLRRPSMHRRFDIPSIVGPVQCADHRRSVAQRGGQEPRSSPTWTSCPWGRPPAARPTWWVQH